MTKTAKEKKAAAAETRVSIADTFRRTKKTVSEKITAYNDTYLVKTIEKGREKVKHYNEKYVSKPFEKGIAGGRKIMGKIPVIGTIEKTVADRLREVPSMINMPSKGEIEKLTLALENLNNNIEILNRQKTA
jgi:hypothetical protein